MVRLHNGVSVQIQARNKVFLGPVLSCACDFHLGKGELWRRCYWDMIQEFGYLPLFSLFPSRDLSHTKVTERTRWNDIHPDSSPDHPALHHFPSILSSLETDMPLNIPVWICYMINHLGLKPRRSFKPMPFLLLWAVAYLFLCYFQGLCSKNLSPPLKAHEVNNVGINISVCKLLKRWSEKKIDLNTIWSNKKQNTFAPYWYLKSSPCLLKF